MQPETASAINTGGPLHETGPAPAGRCAVRLPTLGLGGTHALANTAWPGSATSFGHHRRVGLRQGRAGPGSADAEVNCASDVVPRRSPPKGIADDDLAAVLRAYLTAQLP